MKKLFTLLTLLVCLCTGAWADATKIFDAADAGWTADGVNLTTGTTTVGDVTWYGRSSATIGSDNHNFTDGVNFTKYLRMGGKSTYKSGKTNAGVFTFTPATNGTLKVYCKGAGKSSRHVYVTQTAATSTENDPTIALASATTGDDNSSLYAIIEATVEASKVVAVYCDADNYFYGMTFEAAGAQLPVFSPVSGSLVAEGSKITITSENATSIKYKWTADNTTPTDGWSTYDADAKVTVPASSDGTPYLHAQGFKGEDGGTAGYAQYTITAPDTEAPTLSSTTPADAATNVAVAGNIVLTFNENVACTTNATLTPVGGVAIELTPTVDGATVTYAYTGLTHSKAYTFSLAANSVEDLAGNKYASAISFGFTTVQETVATPTFTVYGNKVIKISCATAGATIYYGGSDVKTGTKTEYTDMFIPAASGTIYAYATKTGANDSEVASQAVTLPVVGDVTGNLLMTLQPDAIPASDTQYESNTFSKAGYSLSSDKALNNSYLAGYPCNFKASVNTAAITITPPSDATIKSVKIYGTSNDNSKVTAVTAGTGGTIISTPSELMVRNIIIGSDVVMSEVVITIDTPTEGAPVSFNLGGTASQARFYVEVYGTTSATEESVTPAKEYTTYVPNHDLDFTSHAKLTAYIATGATADAVTIAAVNKVPAGTPIILKATETGSAITVPVAVSTDDMSGNLLKAGDGKTSIGGDGKYDYVLKDGAFYHASSGTVAVGKAYLHLDAAPAASPAPVLSIDFGTTSISEELRVKSEEFATAPVYNLNGQRVANPTKGLYIVNGKKVVIK